MIITIKKCLNCAAEHEWSYEQPTLKEMRHVKSRTGYSSAEFATGMSGGDPDAMTALIDLLHRREGISLRWDDIDLDYDDFEITPTDEEVAIAEAAGKDEAAEGETPPTSGEPNEEVSTPR